MKFVPYFFSENGDGSDHKVIIAVKVRLVVVAEIGVVFKEVLEFIFFRFEFSILILEHANGSSSVYD